MYDFSLQWNKYIILWIRSAAFCRMLVSGACRPDHLLFWFLSLYRAANSLTFIKDYKPASAELVSNNCKAAKYGAVWRCCLFYIPNKQFSWGPWSDEIFICPLGCNFGTGARRMQYWTAEELLWALRPPNYPIKNTHQDRQNVCSYKLLCGKKK